MQSHGTRIFTSHDCENPKSRTCNIKFQQKQFTSAGPIVYENLRVTVNKTGERDVTMVAETVPETSDTKLDDHVSVHR